MEELNLNDDIIRDLHPTALDVSYLPLHQLREVRMTMNSCLTKFLPAQGLQSGGKKKKIPVSTQNFLFGQFHIILTRLSPNAAAELAAGEELRPVLCYGGFPAEQRSQSASVGPLS